jgi:hypothetical protein
MFHFIEPFSNNKHMRGNVFSLLGEAFIIGGVILLLVMFVSIYPFIR